jgi:hypothetical protein
MADLRMDPVVPLALARWDERCPPADRARAVDTLEAGAVLFFPKLSFDVTPAERRFLAPDWHDPKAKNIRFDVSTGRLGGALGTPDDLAALAGMVGRFAQCARALCATLLADYRPGPAVMRTSYRAIPADDRETSWRKDDRLLHVDAFPSRPNRGARILRVFSNVNPFGAPRVWRVGEPFEQVAARFFPRLPAPKPALARAMAALHITKGVRSAYDHYMLQLHDAMKADGDYQRGAAATVFEFPPGTTWVCYSDQVSHAALRGQYMLEQTLEVALPALRHPERAPLRVLERLAARPLQN